MLLGETKWTRKQDSIIGSGAQKRGNNGRSHGRRNRGCTGDTCHPTFQSHGQSTHFRETWLLSVKNMKAQK